MKSLPLILVLLLFYHPICSAQDSLVGRWLYTGFVYNDHLFSPLDPDLILNFQFEADGTSLLSWTWKESKQHCSRKAIYCNNNNTLIQLVVWTDPQNRPDCKHDPDMTPGSQSQINFFITNNKLYLELYIENNPVYYVLEKN